MDDSGVTKHNFKRVVCTTSYHTICFSKIGMLARCLQLPRLVMAEGDSSSLHQRGPLLTSGFEFAKLQVRAT